MPDRVPVYCYSVGVLAHLQRIAHVLDPRTKRRLKAKWSSVMLSRYRRRNLRKCLRAIGRDYRRHSAWNGYLAEPANEGIFWTRCGHGWTKRRAFRDLCRHVGEIQTDVLDLVA